VTTALLGYTRPAKNNEKSKWKAHRVF